MVNFLFKYDESGELIALISNGSKQSIVRGDNIHYLFDMMISTEIKKIVINHHQMTIYYDNEIAVIDNYYSFSKDQRYSSFNEHIMQYILFLQ